MTTTDQTAMVLLSEPCDQLSIAEGTKRLVEGFRLIKAFVHLDGDSRIANGEHAALMALYTAAIFLLHVVSDGTSYPEEDIKLVALVCFIIPCNQLMRAVVPTTFKVPHHSLLAEIFITYGARAPEEDSATFQLQLIAFVLGENLPFASHPLSVALGMSDALTRQLH
uniref:PRT6_C domain-containing protein n=1 Tax=Angiostrongylus cantonensis TaxID=6313 RepID=A0A0K0DB05_ANGCA